MLKSVLIVLGLLMVLCGGIWTGQGLGMIDGSAMSGERFWAIVGPAVAGLGLALVIVAVTRKSP